MLKKESVDAIAELKALFADSHPCLIPDETGVDVLHVIELKKPLSTGMKVIDQELPRGIENGQVIEIRGRPSTGKTEFLMNIIMTIISPECFGGYESGVIFIDCESSFPIRRFSSILQQKYIQLLEDDLHSSSTALEDYLKNALKRLLIFQPQSSYGLISVITEYFPRILSDIKSKKIRCVCVDSVSSSLWMDQTSPFALKCGTQAMNELLHFVTDNGLVLFGTRRKFVVPTKAPTSWDSSVSYRIILSVADDTPTAPIDLDQYMEDSSSSSDISEKEFHNNLVSSLNNKTPSPILIQKRIFSAEFLVLHGQRHFLLSGGDASVSISSALHALHSKSEMNLYRSNTSSSSSPPDTLSPHSSSTSSPSVSPVASPLTTKSSSENIDAFAPLPKYYFTIHDWGIDFK